MRHSLLIQLNRLSFDRWTRRALRSLLRSTWMALSVWCAAVGLSLVLGSTPNLQLANLLGLGVLAVGLVELLIDRRLPPGAVARRLDRRFRLQEQLSTAVELAGRHPEPESIGAMLLDQSSQTLRQVRRRVAQRQRTPWSDVIALLALVLVAAGLFVLVGIGRPQSIAEPALLPPLAGSAGEAPLEEPFDPTNPQTAPGLGGDQGVTGDVDPNEPGIRRPGQAGQPGDGVTDQSGGEASPGNQQPGADQPTGRQSSPAPLDPAAQRNIDAIADALRDQGVTRPAADALDRGDLARAAQELRELADQAEQLSEDTRRQLADSLRQAATQVQSTDPELAQQLRESARGLERGEERAAEALDNLAGAIEDQAGQPPQSPQGGQAQPGQLPGQGQQPGDAGEGGDGQIGEGDQTGRGSGAGNTGAGEQRSIENPSRLGVDGRPVELAVPPAEGRPSGRSPDQATAGGVSAVGGVSGGGSSGESAGSGPDPLRVPLEERDVVQDYFTP